MRKYLFGERRDVRCFSGIPAVYGFTEGVMRLYYMDRRKMCRNGFGVFRCKQLNGGIVSYSYRKIWLVALPVLVSVLMEHMIGLTDTAFLGRIGEVELGASALGSVYFLSIFMLGFGFSIGAQILIARRNGEKRYGEIGKIFYSGLGFLLVLAAILCGASLLLSPHVLRPVIQSEAVFDATVQYLNWRVFGFFFAFTGVMFRAFFVGVTQTKILTVNSVVMVLTNVVLNYALIFGKFGFPALGIAGAAIASSAAELGSAIFYFWYLARRVDLHKYGFSGGLKLFDVTVLRRVFAISCWTMMQLFLALSVWFIFFIAVEHLGERPLAVVNLVRSLSAIPFIILNSFATAGSSLVSNLIGEEGPGGVFKLGWKVVGTGYLAVLPVLVLLALFPAAALSIYTDNSGLIAATVPAVYVMIVAHLVQTPANIWFNIVSGTGSTRAGLVIELITLAVYLAAVLYLVTYLRCSPAVAWTTEILYQVVMLAGCGLYLWKGRWRDRRI